MKNERYPVLIDHEFIVYEFISEGKKGKISKLVVYSKTILSDFYNLGFGDKNETTGDFDDTVITNNGDSEKVLTTVAGTLYDFTDAYPNAFVFAAGSTKARTRFYRMGISKYLEEIEQDFAIFGLVGENDWQPFKRNIEYEAFLAVRKT